MTTAKDTAYPHFKSENSAGELGRSFEPTEKELAFIRDLVRGPAPQTAMMVHLKMLQLARGGSLTAE